MGVFWFSSRADVQSSGDSLQVLLVKTKAAAGCGAWPGSVEQGFVVFKGVISQANLLQNPKLVMDLEKNPHKEESIYFLYSDTSLSFLACSLLFGLAMIPSFMSVSSLCCC